jgi:hypothetical protein
MRGYGAFEVVAFAIVPYEFGLVEELFDVLVFFFVYFGEDGAKIHGVFD